VLDPACGTGTLLLAAGAAGATHLAGQDADPAAARIAATRLLLAPAGADASGAGRPQVRVVAADSLRADGFGGELAGAVVCWPPFGERSWGYDELTGDPRWQHGLPPRGEGELAWVQHCLAHARPGGGVVVAMPAAAAGRRPGRRIRGNLLRAGALRAVISLPTALVAGADLWVLRRPGPDDRPPSRLLLVDASAGLVGVRAAWSAFRPDADSEPRFESESGLGSASPGSGAVSRSMRIIDLLDDEVDLSPGRHLAGFRRGAAGEPATDYPTVLAALVGACGALAGLPPTLNAPPVRRDLPMSTVGELVRAGVITVEQAPLRMSTDAGDLPVLTARDVRAGRAPTGRARAEPGAVILAPGDVLTPVVGREPVARVVGPEAVSGSGAILGPQVFCFRVDPDRIDPAFLAGFLRIAGSTGAARVSATSARLDARRSPIPLLPLDEQRAYGEAFTRLAALHDTLREATALADTLIHLAHTALSTGTLTP
ncbi:MAG TPA: N-6 DNA methylase, partial [Mycobacteriales bacterium]|nr:N-6 DNA methylase [Mycobacteriales bacterium]